MTEGIKRRNTIRDMQKRTIGEALYSKKLGRKPNASAKKIGVMPQRRSKARSGIDLHGEGRAMMGAAAAWQREDLHRRGEAQR